jgi:hypothetical protein
MERANHVSASQMAVVQRSGRVGAPVIYGPDSLLDMEDTDIPAGLDGNAATRADRKFV